LTKGVSFCISTKGTKEREKEKEEEEEEEEMRKTFHNGEKRTEPHTHGMLEVVATNVTLVLSMAAVRGATVRAMGLTIHLHKRKNQKKESKECQGSNSCKSD